VIDRAAFEPWMNDWTLEADGAPILTPMGRLLPVRRGDEPAMLKIATEPEEPLGWGLLDWWDGDGAARVLAIQGDGLLMERATGTRTPVAEMARYGDDAAATAILCDAIAALHRPRDKAPPHGLATLEDWFQDLWPATAKGLVPAVTAETARRLLEDQREVRPLHGDMHHENVLDFGPRGWLAIDPKRLIGDRAFDYTTLFCDPDLSDRDPPTAVRPEIFERRVEVVLARSGLERARLLDWIVAWCGLSAAWFLQDDDRENAGVNLRVADMALAARRR
jgi:streptomycin 6-kinase